MSRYRRAKTAGGTYFFTVVTYQRQEIFTEEVVIDKLRQAIKTVRKTHPFVVDAWVLLPDHMHCIWTLPPGDSDYSKRMGMIKTKFSSKGKNILHNPGMLTSSRIKHRESAIWQRRFWEHQIRNNKDFERHVDYVHYNPVKHGLVRRVCDWPYSTFHRYVERGVYDRLWAGVEEDTSKEYGE